MTTMEVAGVQLIDDDRICKSIAAGKPFEPRTLQVWRTLCQPPGWAIDIGAYSGLFSIIAAQEGLLVIAVEPLVELQQRIVENASANKVSHRIDIVPAAATSTSGGEIGIGVNDKVHLTSGASVLRKSNQRIVPTWKIDDFDPRAQPVRAIKIDVERHECVVLEGGRRLIREHKPALIVEVLDEEALTAVQLALPEYRTIELMDARNVLMQAR